MFNYQISQNAYNGNGGYYNQSYNYQSGPSHKTARLMGFAAILGGLSAMNQQNCPNDPGAQVLGIIANGLQTYANVRGLAEMNSYNQNYQEDWGNWSVQGGNSMVMDDSYGNYQPQMYSQNTMGYFPPAYSIYGVPTTSVFE